MHSTPANIVHLSPRTEVLYIRPSLEELLHLCGEYKLISSVASENGIYNIQCKDELFTVTESEASILVRGLLIGYFAFHTRDDLALANWLD